MAAALCASYIGGSLNFAATAAALGLAPGKLLAGAMAGGLISHDVCSTLSFDLPSENQTNIAISFPQMLVNASPGFVR